MLQKTLSEVESELKRAEPASEPQTRGKRMVIEEVEDSGDEGDDGSADTGEASFWFRQLLPGGLCCYRIVKARTLL